MPVNQIAVWWLVTLLVLAGSLESASAQQKSATGNAGKNAAGQPQKGSTANAQAKSKDGSVDLVLQSVADRWPIHCTYFESSAGKESPVVVLLTATEGSDKKDARNRRVWQPTAVALQKAGFAVVTVDLRKHGDSVPPTDGGEASALKMAAADYALMAAGDLEAVKSFLLDEHKSEKLNVRKMGIVAMGSSAMVASAFAVADWDKKPYPDGPTLALSTPRGQDVRALVLYSPNTSVKGINSTAVLKTIRGLLIAVHVISSKDNKEDLKNAEKVFKAVDLKDEQFKESRKLTLVSGGVRSEGFLEGRFGDATNKDIIDFLTLNLKQLDFPWISRNDRRQE
jgi:pimeloyl-ACP methyl ester carboxylesterase